MREQASRPVGHPRLGQRGPRRVAQARLLRVGRRHHPRATGVGEVAAELGRDTASFKRDVRKLKELGLTESLDIGYRLSPRGEAVVDDGGPARERPAPPTGTRLPKIGAPATRAPSRAYGVTVTAVPSCVPTTIRRLGHDALTVPYETAR